MTLKRELEKKVINVYVVSILYHNDMKHCKEIRKKKNFIFLKIQNSLNLKKYKHIFNFSLIQFLLS